jgi:hypothetical protein
MKIKIVSIAVIGVFLLLSTTPVAISYNNNDSLELKKAEGFFKTKEKGLYLYVENTYNQNVNVELSVYFDYNDDIPFYEKLSCKAISVTGINIDTDRGFGFFKMFTILTYNEIWLDSRTIFGLRLGEYVIILCQSK